MLRWLNNMTYKQTALLVSALLTICLLIGGQLFVALGYAHPDVSYNDVAWPPLVIGLISLTGFILMPSEHR